MLYPVDAMAQPPHGSEKKMAEPETANRQRLPEMVVRGALLPEPVHSSPAHRGHGGAGADERFQSLAQALSAIYPCGTGEKRWVDGLVGRRKGLGLEKSLLGRAHQATCRAVCR